MTMPICTPDFSCCTDEIFENIDKFQKPDWNGCCKAWWGTNWRRQIHQRWAETEKLTPNRIRLSAAPKTKTPNPWSG